MTPNCALSDVIFEMPLKVRLKLKKKKKLDEIVVTWHEGADVKDDCWTHSSTSQCLVVTCGLLHKI